MESKNRCRVCDDLSLSLSLFVCVCVCVSVCVYIHIQGEHMVPVLQRLKVFASCIGNHDLDYGEPRLHELVRACGFPWLMANVRFKDGACDKRPMTMMMMMMMMITRRICTRVSECVCEREPSCALSALTIMM